RRLINRKDHTYTASRQQEQGILASEACRRMREWPGSPEAVAPANSALLLSSARSKRKTCRLKFDGRSQRAFGRVRVRSRSPTGGGDCHHGRHGPDTSSQGGDLDYCDHLLIRNRSGSMPASSRVSLGRRRTSRALV